MRALIDTGASRSHIDIGVLEGLGLVQTGEIEIYTASTGDRPQIIPLFEVDLWLIGDQLGLFAQNLSVVGSDKVGSLKIEMLLGCDVLEQCLMVYDGVNRRVSLAYNPPTPIEK